MAKVVQVPIFILALSALAGPLRAQHESRQAMPSAKKDPLRALVAAEVHFIVKVCGLPAGEADELAKVASQATDDVALRLTEARSNRNWRSSEAPVTITSEIDRVLKPRLSKPSWLRLHTERTLLATRLRHAAIELLLASLDELLLLDDEQRVELRDLLRQKWAGAWRPPESWRGLLHADRTPWQRATTRGALALVCFPKAELKRVLRPSQCAASNQAAFYAQQLLLKDRSAGAYWRKEPLFGLSLERLGAAVELSQAERTKLRLAGKLDLDGNSATQRVSPPNASTGYMVDGLLPAGMLPEDVPAYVKAVGSILGDEQSRGFDNATRERWRFHQSADLHSIVAACQRRCVLTVAQCDDLLDILRERLPEAGQQTYDRRATFAAVADVPASQWEDICDEFQIELIAKCLAELHEVVRDCEQKGRQ
ncbi:MAG TPA: hypothetical protein VFI31_13335 [Pirellulales bacterium]|nr:hypothetical protein [Pirellulales bacterium]